MDNLPKRWGIRRKDLGLLRFDTLKKIFYGINNLDIPVEMCDRQNPDETLAQYLSVFDLKRHSIKDIQHFPDLIRLMNNSAYNSKDFLNLANSCNKRFPRLGENGQKERLFSLSPDIKMSFMESFHSQLRLPGKDFYDPNSDGKNSNLYINKILKKVDNNFSSERRVFNGSPVYQMSLFS